MKDIGFFKGLATISYVYVIMWLIYTFGFSRGYDDAKNDYAKRGYNFNNTVRAFP